MSCLVKILPLFLNSQNFSVSTSSMLRSNIYILLEAVLPGSTTLFAAAAGTSEVLTPLHGIGNK